MDVKYWSLDKHGFACKHGLFVQQDSIGMFLNKFKKIDQVWLYNREFGWAGEDDCTACDPWQLRIHIDSPALADDRKEFIID